MAEPTEVLAGLTPLAQVGYGIAMAFALGGIGIWQFLKTKAEEREKKSAEEEHEHFDPAEILAAAPVLKFFANIEELAVCARISAEAVRNISAVATIAGKRWENGYDEARVWMAVDKRWQELMDREGPHERPSRRRGPGSGGWGAGS